MSTITVLRQGIKMLFVNSDPETLISILFINVVLIQTFFLTVYFLIIINFCTIVIHLIIINSLFNQFLSPYNI